MLLKISNENFCSGLAMYVAMRQGCCTLERLVNIFKYQHIWNISSISYFNTEHGETGKYHQISAHNMEMFQIYIPYMDYFKYFIFQHTTWCTLKRLVNIIKYRRTIWIILNISNINTQHGDVSNI